MKVLPIFTIALFSFNAHAQQLKTIELGISPTIVRPYSNRAIHVYNSNTDSYERYEPFIKLVPGASVAGLISLAKNSETKWSAQTGLIYVFKQYEWQGVRSVYSDNSGDYVFTKVTEHFKFQSIEIPLILRYTVPLRNSLGLPIDIGIIPSFATRSTRKVTYLLEPPELHFFTGASGNGIALLNLFFGIGLRKKVSETFAVIVQPNVGLNTLIFSPDDALLSYSVRLTLVKEVY